MPPSPQEKQASAERTNRRQAKVILDNYIAALKEGDGNAACGLMAPDLRATSAIKEGGRRLSCAETIDRVTKDTEFRRIQQRLKVSGTIAEGNTVIFRVAYLGHDIAFYDLARENGRWQIVAIREIK
jgi:hypothetical protein